MAATAHLSDRPAETVRIGLVDMRRGGSALGGSHLHEGTGMITGWHSHNLHQIEYAMAGVVEVETASAHYLLPPQQAAWIPAGLEHQATLNPGARTIAVLFDPGIIPHSDGRARILAVPTLIREMMIYAVRWPIARVSGDPVSDGFFRTLGHLVVEALEHEAPLSLPTSSDPVVSAAIAHTQAHLDAVSVGEVSRAVGVSERTLRRQFQTTLGMSWRDYLLQARLLRAMALLASPALSVLEVSTAVGFENPSAFARAFAQHCGEKPSAYRRRTSGAAAPSEPGRSASAPRDRGYQRE